MINVRYSEEQVNETLLYAVNELKNYLNQTQITFDLTIRLLIDETQHQHGCHISKSEQEMTITAANTANILWGIYRFLDKLGFYFEANGCKVVPQEVKESQVNASCGTYKPHVLKRGIRQHINFPMDISSYPLEEALEYIRNLARCGFNAITFHSYPGQWYAYTYEDKSIYAGKFFYGEAHPVPQNAIITPYIRNQKNYVIPEMEREIGNAERLSELAIEWLQTLMKEAKRCGMTIQFSFEPRDASAEETLAIIQHIDRTYPLIDVLEMVTEECGGYRGSAYSVEELEDKITQLFGEEVKKKCKPYIRAHLGQLPGPLNELARNLQVIDRAKQNGLDKKICLGLYLSEVPSLNICLEIMKTCAPKDVDFACLTAHGAKAVADNLQGMAFDAVDLNRTIPYTWIEFDGSMYEQQASIDGIYQCIKVIEKKMGADEIVPALLANHWRTAENSVTMNYLAYACNYGVDKKVFFDYYCEKYKDLGSKEVQNAFERLEKASDTIRYHLGNSGFCYLNCWFNSGLGLIGSWRMENVNQALYDYNCALKAFRELSQTPNEHIALVINRMECSILHLTALKTLMELQACCNKNVEDITLEEKQKIKQICQNASFYIDAYMRLHCQMMPDRGCEGTIISYEHTLNGVIKRICNQYLGEEIGAHSDGHDAPPAPDIL